MKKIILILLLNCFITVSYVYSFDLDKYKKEGVHSDYSLYKTMTYFSTTGTPFTVFWDPNPEPDISHYDIRVYLIEQERYTLRDSTSDTEYTFTPTVAGHYAIEVRAVDLAGQTSGWICTMDDNNTQPAWWVYVHIAPPGEIIW